MLKIISCLSLYVVLYSLIRRCNCALYTYEDIELRRIFPSEFPQDTIRKSGSLDPEHLGRYGELKSYFKYPKAKVNSHFEELVCYDREDRKIRELFSPSAFETEDDPYGDIKYKQIKSKSLCRIDLERYSPEEDAYYMSPIFDSHVDRRRVYCFMLLCFTEDELDRVVASF